MKKTVSITYTVQEILDLIYKDANIKEITSISNISYLIGRGPLGKFDDPRDGGPEVLESITLTIE